MKIKIKIENLQKTFGTKHVLKGINLDVAPGESLVIIGGSGNGKSVLLKCLIGIMIPDAGSHIEIDNTDITFTPISKRSDFVKNFGMLFQGGALFDSLTIADNICFGLLQSGAIKKSEILDYAVEKLKLVGLKPETAGLLPVELSGGMQKRAALARAIAADPKVIFFDEPTSGLDPIMTGVISDLIKDISKKIGATTLTITHDMECANRIADKIAMIHDGNLVWNGTEIYNSNNPYVEQFIKGSSQGPIAV